MSMKVTDLGHQAHEGSQEITPEQALAFYDPAKLDVGRCCWMEKEDRNQVPMYLCMGDSLVNQNGGLLYENKLPLEVEPDG